MRALMLVLIGWSLPAAAQQLPDRRSYPAGPFGDLVMSVQMAALPQAAPIYVPEASAAESELRKSVAGSTAQPRVAPPAQREVRVASVRVRLEPVRLGSYDPEEEEPDDSPGS